MGPRVLSHLWSMVMAPDAPQEVVRSGALQDALVAYQQAGNPTLLPTYMVKCLDKVRRAPWSSCLRASQAFF